MIGIIVSGGLSFLFVLVSTFLGVNYFKSRNIGQNIQEEVVHHEHKKGTPTMGGIFLILGTSFGFFASHINFWTIGRGFEVVLRSINQDVLALLIIAIAMALVGLVDDYLKVKGNRNLGLTVKQKFVLQFLAGLLAAVYIYNLGYSTQLYIFSGFGIDIGFFKWILIVFVFVGITNAVNLTDGLDGLATVPVILVAGCFGFISYVSGNVIFADYLLIPYIEGVGEVAVFCGAIIGASIGFLWFNAPPAKIFMGDTGSLALGGSLGAIGITTKHEIVLAITGGLFVLEAISVIVQVVSFKLTGKRIFMMAPIHHHFEKKGWAESTIVIRFWIISLILAMIGLATLKLR